MNVPIKMNHFNFDRVVRQRQFCAVLFTNPRCGGSVFGEIVREFRQAAIYLRSDENLTLAKLDVSHQINRYRAMYCKVFTIPRVMILSDQGKKVVEYKGPRDCRGIIDCLRRLCATFPAEIKSKKLIADDKIVIVGVFPEFSGQDYENFIHAADIFKWNYDVCVTLDAKHLPNGDSIIGSGPVVRVYVPFKNVNGEKRFVDTTTFNVEALVKFVEEATTPVVYLLNGHPQRLVTNFFDDTKNERAVLLIDFGDESAGDFVSNYHQVANKYKGQGIIFMLGSLEARNIINWYGGCAWIEEPLIVITNLEKVNYVKLGVEADEVISLVENYKDDKGSKFVKSEQMPDTDFEPVKVVVSDTFEEMVINSKKNVLLMLYRPEFQNWCSEVVLVLNDVALYFEEEDDDGIVIAMLNESANDIRIDDLKNDGDSPALYFFPAVNKDERKRYDGDITSKTDIIYFIDKCRYDPLKKQKRSTGTQDMDCS